jgi:NAD(P)H-dependent FMN reductase
MKLTCINGSPRGQSSNSKVLLGKFLEGFRSVENGYAIEEVYLKGGKNHAAALEAFQSSDIVLFAFPLYTDSMPGIVKEFFETIDLKSFDNASLKLGFLVQSGFPEGHHSVYVKRYLDKLARRLGVDYLGTIIRGGVEGLQIQPRWMTRYLDLFYELGQQFALEMEFNQSILEKLKKPVHLNRRAANIYRILRWLGLTNYYWNSQLKKNNAYGQRYARPYTPVS